MSRFFMGTSSSANRRIDQAPSALMLLVVDGRNEPATSCPTIHPPAGAVEGAPHSRGLLSFRALGPVRCSVFNHPGRFHNAARARRVRHDTHPPRYAAPRNGCCRLAGLVATELRAGLPVAARAHHRAGAEIG